MIALRSVVLLVVSLQVLAAQEPSSSSDSGAKTWVGRNQEFEEYLKTAECEHMQA